MRVGISFFILCFAASAVHASDGVFEINADCAVFGCFDGDSGGYPVTISNPGSYRLTSNLTTDNVDTTLISVTTDTVTIDLNGFALTGPVTCSGTPIFCSDLGSGAGINTSDIRFSVSVFNGTVRGMGSLGIFVGENSIIENIKLIENRSIGIVLAGEGGSLAKNISAIRNGQSGISPGSGDHLVMDSVVRDNGSRGISGGFCSNIFSVGNGTDTTCTGIATNRCENPTLCD